MALDARVPSTGSHTNQYGFLSHLSGVCCTRGASPHAGDHSGLQSVGGGTLMAIQSKDLEPLKAIIATAPNIVTNRTLADLYLRQDFMGHFRIRVHLASGQRYVITIKDE